MSANRQYPTDLTDEQWELIQPLLPERKWQSGGRGRPPVDLRRVINGIFYLKKTGCQWRMLPKDFGNWSTVYGYFKRWRGGEVWADLMKQLRQMERVRQGRKPEPSAGSIDSQSIKTATQNDDIGFDWNKRIKGRKRHILVDTLGLIIAVVVTAANESREMPGLCRYRDLFDLKIHVRIPALEDAGQFPVEHPHSRL